MTVVVRGAGDGPFPTEIDASGHRFAADEPVDAGGGDTGPAPYDLLLAALGACTAMTVRLYAGRRGWPLQGVTVTLDHDRIHAQDCADCMTKEGRLDRISLAIQLTGDLTPNQRAQLLEVARRCPVHRTLTSELVVDLRPAG
ncbi:MAG TPA: OsmC family protein [Micromonosporaceae bacterium]|nr:OsmC family protein [Micromonosporaceae bacterium]